MWLRCPLALFSPTPNDLVLPDARLGGRALAWSRSAASDRSVASPHPLQKNLVEDFTSGFFAVFSTAFVEDSSICSVFLIPFRGDSSICSVYCYPFFGLENCSRGRRQMDPVVPFLSIQQLATLQKPEGTLLATLVPETFFSKTRSVFPGFIGAFQKP